MEDTSAGYTCSTCGKVCKNALGLSGHQRSHGAKKSLEVLKEAQPATAAAVEVQTAQEIKKEEPKKAEYRHDLYRQLPQPIVEHLEMTFGNWLNYFEIGQEWKEDFGGYGMYIKVPREYSTEWKEFTTIVHDNATRKAIGEKKEILPDVRWKPIKEVAEVKGWIDLVKQHIMNNAHQKGIRLPNTNTGIDETKATFDQYQASIQGQKQSL